MSEVGTVICKGNSPAKPTSCFFCFLIFANWEAPATAGGTVSPLLQTWCLWARRAQIDEQREVLGRYGLEPP